MTLKEIASRIFAAYVHRKNAWWIANPVPAQQRVFRELIRSAGNTAFGKDHHFDRIQTPADFAREVPVRDYEGLRPYVDRILQGEEDVLWPGKPLYLAKTSGTTSGVKYIPITRVSIREQVRASRNAILNYIHQTGNSAFVNGKMIFLQGSPELTEKNGIQTGRLSGISAHYVPGYLQKNRLPSWETNCIEEWETKVDRIVEETANQPMSVIAGIPSWVQMYFEKLRKQTGKSVGELFPDFNLFIYGGVNFEPYRNTFTELIGRHVDSIELFPASEGFFAYQDQQGERGLLLLLSAGIFYEFIRADEFQEANPRRYTIGEVELGVNYVMILSTHAGLWGYNLGDTVAFTSLKPYRVIVTGRIKHFISAFGEHVIAKEVEYAMETALNQCGGQVSEFTVAPMIDPPEKGLPYHEWWVEFEREPEDLETFIQVLDQAMQQQNSYYFDLIDGNILQTLKVRKVAKGGFQAYMKSIGKLGGQNKVQRLANDRKLAEGLAALSGA
ncbi:GH3 auxin-responsive promoter family protein [Robiginitalea sp. M366]|uniref:GH3 auxin-responsive promoter family protein n=1 Tax=Robiginitalea aestuariiviva TaxID=3036903 RepID=UPI00240E004D|nr:GH3 auxin-responsive promoter family protein [Robiginitalea aestuariiviva]MDG1571488.1 GH3 auxin-responsive promoter family protein [Robiginitalea aestuariiviva]